MKHLNLDEQARRIAAEICKVINKAAMETQDPTMPYKAQYILEEVIKILKDSV